MIRRNEVSIQTKALEHMRLIHPGIVRRDVLVYVRSSAGGRSPDLVGCVSLLFLFFRMTSKRSSLSWTAIFAKNESASAALMRNTGTVRRRSTRYKYRKDTSPTTDRYDHTFVVLTHVRATKTDSPR